MAICPRCNGTGQIAGGGGQGGGGPGNPFDPQMAAQQGNNAGAPGMGRASPSLQAHSIARDQGGDQRQTGGYHPLTVSQPGSNLGGDQRQTGGYHPLVVPNPNSQGVLSGLANQPAPQQQQQQLTRRIM
jgi:hypothetical protein